MREIGACISSGVNNEENSSVQIYVASEGGQKNTGVRHYTPAYISSCAYYFANATFALCSRITLRSDLRTSVSLTSI